MILIINFFYKAIKQYGKENRNNAFYFKYNFDVIYPGLLVDPSIIYSAQSIPSSVVGVCVRGGLSQLSLGDRRGYTLDVAGCICRKKMV